jgi:very-short-patch-repair endonuclease
MWQSRPLKKRTGIRKVNYKMRDAAFSRQRYWGEPFPIVWKNGIAYPLDESELPLELPHVDSYKPGPDGEGPLANIKEWALIPSPPTPLHGVERGAALIPGPSPQVEKGAALIPGPSPQVEKGAARVPKYAVYTPMQYELAKRMRKEYTEAEGELWELLRDSKLGVKFRRQHPIDKYIVDFVCLQERLIVEVDGGYHNDEEQKQYDEVRTRVLNTIGFEVLRFTNEEVIADPYKIKDGIKAKIVQKKRSRRTSSPPAERVGVRDRGRGKPTPCPAMPVHPGIFSVIWTRTIKKNSVIEKYPTTGTRWICTSAAPSMPWAICSTAACGPSSCLIWI